MNIEYVLVEQNRQVAPAALDKASVPHSPAAYSKDNLAVQYPKQTRCPNKSEQNNNLHEVRQKLAVFSAVFSICTIQIHSI